MKKSDKKRNGKVLSALRIRDPGRVKNQDPDPEWTSRIIFPRA
jgi:hypothetical protein